MDLEMRKLPICVVFCCADVKHGLSSRIEAFEMWIERVSNEEILNKIKESGKLLVF